MAKGIIIYNKEVYTGVLISVMMYGIHTCLFATMLQYMLRAKTPRMSKCAFTHAYAMFILGTINLVTSIITASGAETLEDKLGGSGIAYIVVAVLASGSLQLSMTLQDSMLIYRLLVIWNFRYMVIVVPVLILCATFALFIIVMVITIQPVDLARAYALPCFSLSLALNLSLTVAIIGRLMFLQKRLKKLGLGNGNLYTNLAGMFFESGALYTSVVFVYLISLIANTRAQEAIILPLGQAVCIASELIWLRVAKGRAWTRELSARTEVPAQPIKGSERILWIQATRQATTEGPSGSPIPIRRAIDISSPQGERSTTYVLESLPEAIEDDRSSALQEVAQGKGQV